MKLLIFEGKSFGNLTVIVLTKKIKSIGRKKLVSIVKCLFYYYFYYSQWDSIIFSTGKYLRYFKCRGSHVQYFEITIIACGRYAIISIQVL